MELSSLQAAIEERPDDPARYAVLGDLLLCSGDPRGELITLQLEPRRTPAQRSREQQLLADPRIRIRRPRRAQWRWGFVHTLAFEAVSDGGPDRRWVEDLTTLLAHPSCRFIRDLIVEADRGDLALEVLSARPPPVLRSLHLVCNEVDLAAAGPGLGKLERLVLVSQLVVPAALPMPGLTALQLPLDALSTSGLAMVLEPVKGSLTALTLTTFEPVEPEALSPVLSLPRLTELTIRGDVMSRAAVDALCESPLTDRLERLDVSRSGLSVEGAQRLLKRAGRFHRLSTLVLGDAADGQ